MTEQKKLPRIDCVDSLKREIADRLVGFGIEPSEAGVEADMIVENIFDLTVSQQLTTGELSLDGQHVDRLDTVIGARKKRVPIQYILEEAYFMGLKLIVRPGVFIPRPDTETLVEVSIEKLKQQFPGSQRLELLEIGVGSGAIAVSLLHLIGNVNVVALDVSDAALAAADENARLHNVSVRLRLKREPQWWTINQRFHAIISNPPYIPRSQASGLQPEVELHEPEAALYGTDEDGLGFYRKICQTARDVIHRSGGFIAVEVGDGQAQPVRALFEGAGFSDVQTHDDLNGIARVVSAVCV